MAGHVSLWRTEKADAPGAKENHPRHKEEPPPANQAPLSAADPQAQRERLLKTLQEAARADGAAFYHLADVNGTLRIAYWQATGDPALQALFQQLQKQPDTKQFLPPTRERKPLDLTRPSPLYLKSFFENSLLLSRDTFEQSTLFTRFYAPYDLSDCIQLLVYAGDTFIGWLGAFRKKGAPLFTRSERRRLNTLVPRAQKLLLTTHAQERAALPQGKAFLLVRPDGELECASAEGAAWLSYPWLRNGLRELIEAESRGEKPLLPIILCQAELRLYPMDGPLRRYLLRVTPTRPVKRLSESSLTPSQQQIAQCAAQGATVAEIAKRTGRNAETIRWHLRAAYQKLGVSNRVELALALQLLTSHPENS